MAVTKIIPESYREWIVEQFSGHTFKLILLDDSITFSASTHGQLSDVSAAELSTGNGYVSGGYTLSGATTSIVSGDVVLSFDNVAVTANGGSIGPFYTAAIIDDTTDDDLVLAGIDLGQNETITDGKSYLFANIKVEI